MIMESTRQATRQELIEEVERLRKELIKEKEKNKELMKPKYLIDVKTGKIDKLTNDFISKDKIREKIEEYNKMFEATFKEPTHQADIRRDVCLEIRNQLQELLEERN